MSQPRFIRGSTAEKAVWLSTGPLALPIFFATDTGFVAPNRLFLIYCATTSEKRYGNSPPRGLSPSAPNESEENALSNIMLALAGIEWYAEAISGPPSFSNGRVVLPAEVYGKRRREQCAMQDQGYLPNACKCLPGFYPFQYPANRIFSDQNGRSIGSR